MKLYDAKNEVECEVKEMPSMAMLNSFGVYIGAKIIKKNTYKMGGPVLILVKGREIAIGKDIANEIEVEEVA